MGKKLESTKMKKSTGKKIKNESKEKMVEFIFQAPEASHIYLTGEFNQWDLQSLPMKKNKEGVWKTKINLPPGRYEYKLFTDGVWVHDLPGFIKVDDIQVQSLPGSELVPNPFGTQNMLLIF